MSSKKNKRNLWMLPWSYMEGTIITVAIILLGFGFQAASGGTVLRVAGFPWNLIAGIVFLCLLGLFYFLWKKQPFVKGIASVKTALPAILGFTFLVLLMGFVKQEVSSKNPIIQLLGLNHLTKTWPFILINLYLMMLLGIVTMKRLTPFNIKNAGFFLNHFGLFLVLFSTALGSSDMQRLTMNCYEGRTEQRASNAAGHVAESPFSIRLIQFNIDEFKPKITIVDSKTGAIVPEKGKSQFILLDLNSFDIDQYHIDVEQFLESASKSGEEYQASSERGSAPAAKLKVTNSGNQFEYSGWICSGSFNQPPETLKLDNDHLLVMLPAEPRKFSSELEIRTKDRGNVHSTIEVNQPFSISGWKIYQLGYDTEMGRWSELSILELVKDPWLPVVYFGIFLMMAGAGFLFIYGKPKNGGTEHVA